MKHLMGFIDIKIEAKSLNIANIHLEQKKPKTRGS